MKTSILALIVFVISTSSHSQVNKKSTYLIVRLERLYDYNNERSFYNIKAEGYNPHADEIYRLVLFNNKKKAQNDPGILFFVNRKDTSTILYNYFLNSTEALNFLGDKGWELVSVQNDIKSGYATERVGVQDQIYTTVSFSPVYYFKKEIK